jgi:hypothetical protein
MLGGGLVVAGLLNAKGKILPFKKYDISKYETYQWLPPRAMTRQGLLEDDPVLAPIIRQVVSKFLIAKGYRASGLGLATALIGGQKDIDKTINKAASNLLKKLPQSQRTQSPAKAK